MAPSLLCRFDAEAVVVYADERSDIIVCGARESWRTEDDGRARGRHAESRGRAGGRRACWSSSGRQRHELGAA